MIIKLTWLLLTAVLFCEMPCSATLINSGDQYFVKLAGKQTGCADKGVVKFMSYLNNTCSESGPVLRAASDGKTWTKFTFTKVGKSASGEDLVAIQTYYPKSSSTPRCQGYVVPEKKDACLEVVARKVRIQAKKGDTWSLSAVKGKKDTYTIRAYSRKSGCLKYLAASAACGEKYLQLDAKDDGSGRQQWTILPVNPSSSPPPQFVEIPAVNYSIAVTGYTKQSFGAPQQTAFCNSILNSTAYPQDYMKCIVSSVSEVPYQGSSSSSGRKLAQAGTVYVRGYTAFEFIYNNNTSQQQAQDAADGLFKKMDSPATLQTMFQSSFSSSTVTPDAVDRGEVPVPESTLPTPDSPSPSSPSSPTPSSPTSSSPSIPTPTSPSPELSSPTLSPTFNTVPGGDGVFNLPPVTSPVPVPTPVPTPTPTPTPAGPSATAFVVNFGSNSVQACIVSGGTLTSCVSPYTGPAAGTFTSPFGIAISGSTAYIPNSAGPYTITACTISGGALTTCATPFTGGSFNTPRGIALLTDSTGTTMYISNQGGNSITACTVSGLVISNCATPFTGSVAGTFDQPAGIAISGNRAFVVNSGSGSTGNSVVSCTISGLSISACSTPFTGSAGTFVAPYAIAISGSTAYIANFSTLVACTISSGVIISCSTPYVNAVSINLPDGIAIYDSKAYISNEGGGSYVSVCTISPGVISNCVQTTPTGGSFSTLAGIAIV